MLETGVSPKSYSTDIVTGLWKHEAVCRSSQQFLDPWYLTASQPQRITSEWNTTHHIRSHNLFQSSRHTTSYTRKHSQQHPITEDTVNSKHNWAKNSPRHTTSYTQKYSEQQAQLCWNQHKTRNILYPKTQSTASTTLRKPARDTQHPMPEDTVNSKHN